MNWCQKVVLINLDNAYHRVIQDVETKETIAIVDVLNDEFVFNIIDKHNRAINNARQDGANIIKEVYKNTNIKK